MFYKNRKILAKKKKNVNKKISVAVYANKKKVEIIVLSYVRYKVYIEKKRALYNFIYYIRILYLFMFVRHSTRLTKGFRKKV